MCGPKDWNAGNHILIVVRFTVIVFDSGSLASDTLRRTKASGFQGILDGESGKRCAWCGE